MNRTFCDLCDAPAVGTAYVKHVSKRRLINAGPADATKVEMNVTFSLRDHPTGFGGPPDLCRGCLSVLLKAKWSRPGKESENAETAALSRSIGSVFTVVSSGKTEA